MQILESIQPFLFGSLFSVAIFMLAKWSCKSYNKVYHSCSKTEENIQIVTTLLLSAALSVCAFWQPVETAFLAEIILSLVVMNLVAYSDILTGRIPISLLFLGLSTGVILGLMSETLLVQTLGGVLNFGIGLLIYHGGEIYVDRIRHRADQPIAFGMGDVYGAAVIGFLTGFPQSVIALVLSLSLALIVGLAVSLIAKRTLSEVSVRLGFYYFLAVVFVLFFTRSS
jgi:hypothetical protein